MKCELVAFTVSVVIKLPITFSKARTPEASKCCGQHGKSRRVLLPSQCSSMFYVPAPSTFTPDCGTCGSVNLRTTRCSQVSHVIGYRSISANFVLWKFDVRYSRNFSVLKWYGAVSERVCWAGPAIPSHHVCTWAPVCVCMYACMCVWVCTAWRGLVPSPRHQRYLWASLKKTQPWASNISVLLCFGQWYQASGRESVCCRLPKHHWWHLKQI